MRRFLLLSLVAGVLLAAQTPSPEASQTQAGDDGPSIKLTASTTLVVIPVSVTDASGRFVLGLEKSDFTISEDDVAQTITHFSAEDAPLSVGLLVDTSGSMGAKLDVSRRAVAEFMKTLNAGDETFLIEFADQAKLVQDFTSNGADIESKMAALQPEGLTALIDAAQMGVGEMKKAKNARKALVIVSDGGDNHSRYTPDQLKNFVREADTQVYAMGVFEPVLFPGLSGAELSGPKLLAEIADQTGGRAFGASEFKQLPDIAERIAIELRNQYVIAYTPTNKDRDGKYRNVTVKVKQPAGLPAIKARWRTGYYAPTDLPE